MSNLATTYMGLSLKNPIIASSSSLTDSVEKIVALEKSGVGAVVIKSLFEEEIIIETEDNMNRMQSSGFVYPETLNYFEYDDMQDMISNYLKLITDAKKSVQIPIIASINCVSATKWPEFAKRIEKAGADAIELNVFVLPTDFDRPAKEIEQVHFDAVSRVTELVNIPVSIKISNYNTTLGSFIKRLSESSAKAVVLFNRSYNPDFDIHTLDYTDSAVLSTPQELAFTLRWIAVMANRVSSDLSASTGIHDGFAAIKAILAGANSVQIASTLYKNGLDQVGVMLRQIEEWMKEKGYSSIDDFRGKLSQEKSHNPAVFERVQFMKFFRGRN